MTNNDQAPANNDVAPNHAVPLSELSTIHSSRAGTSDHADGLSKPVAVLCGLILSAGTLALTRANWLQAGISDAVGSVSTIQVQGSASVPALGALALAMLAVSAAMTMARRGSRYVYGLLLLLLALGSIAVMINFMLNPTDAARSTIQGDSSLASTVVSASVVPIWPWLAILLCVLVVGLVGAILRRGGGWGLSARFSRHQDAPISPGIAPSVSREGTSSARSDDLTEPGFSDAAEDWDALSRGEELK